MSTRWLAVAIFAVCAGACAVPVSVPVPEPVSQPTPEPDIPVPIASDEDIKALAEGNNAFAIDLYKKLAENEQGNIIFSPFSIRTALAMTYAGARGQTAAEMRKALHFTLPDDRLHPAIGATAHQLKREKDVPPEPTDDAPAARLKHQLSSRGTPFRLNVANALWGQKGSSFRSDFLDLTKRNYAGGFYEVDFATDTEEARRTINHWVEEKTHDKIKELLKRGDINPAVQLVLTNAIYLKAAWARPFPKTETKEGPFEVGPDEKVMMPMMHSSDASFRYLATEECEWLELPYTNLYADDRLAMLVLLPRKGRFAAVERSLTAPAIQKVVEKLSFYHGSVTIPKFQVRMDARLREQLGQMGMLLAFSDGADFSGITDNRELHIGSVIHQAYLNVDEAGSEAAAATAVMMYCSLPPPFSFTADRPFIFLIRDNKTGNILFLGRVVRPGKLS